MALKVNTKQKQKVIKMQSELLMNFRYENSERTDYNYREWVAEKDFNQPEFKKIFGSKESELSIPEILYIHTHVMRKAWERYWKKLHDRLQKEK